MPRKRCRRGMRIMRLEYPLMDQPVTCYQLAMMARLRGISISCAQQDAATDAEPLAANGEGKSERTRSDLGAAPTSETD